MRVDYYHTGNAKQERFSLDRVVVEPLPWPGNPTQPIDRTQSRQVFLRGARAHDRARALFARVCVDLRRVGNDRRSQVDEPHVSRVAAVSRADAPVRIVLRKRDARNQFADVWTIDVDPKDMFVDPSPPASPGPLIELQKNGDPASKLDLLILGDGYTRGRARQVRSATPGGCCERALRHLAVQGAAARHQRLGAGARRRRSRASRGRRSGIHRRSPLGTSYDAFGLRALRPDVREPGVPRARRRTRRTKFVEILTNSRDLRRRRHLQSVQHGRRRQRVGAVRLRPRVRPPLRRTRRRVLHVGRRLSAGDRSGRAVGAERHGAARSGER